MERNGDAQYLQQPASARWDTPTLLPFHLARGILGISDQIAFRRAAQTFDAVHALGCGFDNCYSEGKARADLETVLADVARGPSRSRDSAAENLLGILAYADTETTGTTKPASVDGAVADFQSAVALDPASADAKYNLEWLLRSLVAKGTRNQNTESQDGGRSGHKGGGSSRPNRGY